MVSIRGDWVMNDGLFLGALHCAIHPVLASGN